MGELTIGDEQGDTITIGSRKDGCGITLRPYGIKAGNVVNIFSDRSEDGASLSVTDKKEKHRFVIKAVDDGSVRLEILDANGEIRFKAP